MVALADGYLPFVRKIPTRTLQDRTLELRMRQGIAHTVAARVVDEAERGLAQVRLQLSLVAIDLHRPAAW